MKLKIKFGKLFELNRIKNSLSKLDWYNSQGYKISLPEAVGKDSTDDEIKEAIEYNEEDFKDYANKLTEEFSLINDKYFETLKEIFDVEIPEVYEVYLTKYGVGGSYNLPNKIIKKITAKKEGIKTIVHEIIHLIIQPLIDKNKISHWEKERIVDLILNSKEFSFLGYDIWQKDYHGAEKIDELFEEYFFEDVKGFFEKIKK
jgi:hypothetical protein